MRIYIAAKYRRRFELRAVVEELTASGHECTSRWIDNGEEEAGGAAAAAEMDIQDVLRADAILFIGEPQGSENTGGGRWFELGMAYHANKHCVVIVGQPRDTQHIGTVLPGHETVFTALPSMHVCRSLAEALAKLEALA